jgi:uncharacterized protein YjiK
MVNRLSIVFASALACALSPSAQAQFSLSNYSVSASYPLPTTPASEASAVTFNWNSGSLFVLGDEGDALVEVDAKGNQLSVMTLTGFDDTEGLTYIGNNQFVLLEERLQDAYLLTYQPGGSVDRTALKSASLGDTVGNVGLEGISFDPISGAFVAVKEKTPQQALKAVIDFTAGTAQVTNLFTPNLGVLDLSDVQHLSTVPGLVGTPDAENLLIYSQESLLLMEVDPMGNILSSLDFSAFSPVAEGVTIGPDGTIYIVSEEPTLHVLTPIPAPGSMSVLGLALMMRRRLR